MVDDLPVVDGQKAAPVDFHAGEGRGPSFREEGVRVDGVLVVQVEDREVAFFERHSEPDPGVDGHEFDQAVEGDMAGFDEVGIADREGGLNADDAKGAAGKALRLLLFGVGRVVGGDHVDGAVLDGLDDGLTVVRRPQGRVHLEAALLEEFAVVEDDVVRTGFTGDVDAPRFGLPDEVQAFGDRHVADVVAAAGLFGEDDVSADFGGLALRVLAPVAVQPGIVAGVDVSFVRELVDLTVGADDFVDGCGPFHEGFHHVGGLDASAVVGEAEDVGCQLFDGDDLLPQLAHRQGGVGIAVDDRIPVDDVLLDLQVFQTVRDRVQVRHGGNAGEPAVGRRPASGQNGLLIRKTRLSEMHMHIKKTGK